jgi:SnoaL-like domain
MSERLKDLEEIRQLKTAFAWNFDGSQPDALADLFTDDAVCEFGPWGSMIGRDDIRRGFRRRLRSGDRFPGIHALTNPIIELNDDEASGQWYLLDLVFGEADVNPLRLIGIYDERYRRVEHTWRITYCSLQVLWSTVSGRVTDERPLTSRLKH